MFDLTNKSAIVLGGAGGIGKEICIQLIKRGLKKLSVIDVVEEAKAKDVFVEDYFQKVSFIYRPCSVTDEETLSKCMSLLKTEMGGLDVVINSVGILDEQSPQMTIDINYGGVVNSTFIAIDLMRADKGGKGGIVINIASITSLGAHFWLPVYAGSKHAVLGFTRSLNNDKFNDKTGVKFMAICPGVTHTSMATVDNIIGRHCFPEMKKEVQRLLSSFPAQEVDCVGKCILAALDDGENGSTWQCENNRIEKLNIKDYPKFT